MIFFYTKKLKESNMKKFTILIVLTLALNSCGLLGDKISPASLEALKTSEPSTTGIISTLAVRGGSVAIASAGAKVSASAGELSTPLSIQASADPIDNEGQGITISGDWTKPITVEYAIPAGVTDPENYKIMLRLNNGYWITCRKPKVNLATNTVSVRLAASIKPKSASKARPMASKYSMAFAKTFYLKPDKGTIKVGESMKFTAYAREGYVPREIMGKIYDSEAEFEAGLKKLMDAIEDLESNDDDLVPIPKLNTPDDDELVPLNAVVNEYPFTNNKTGFTRTWTAKSIGTVKADGNAGATYTAPKDDAAKGKTVKVVFSSTNDKTKRNATADATVFIEDGIPRYLGTFSFTELSESDVPTLAFPTNKYTILRKSTGKFTIKLTSDGYKLDLSLPKEASVSEYKYDLNQIKSTGDFLTVNETLSSAPDANWAKYANRNILEFNANNTYNIAFDVPSQGGQIQRIVKNKGFGVTDGSFTENYFYPIEFTSYKNSGADNTKITDKDALVGENTWQNKEFEQGKLSKTITYTAKWNFLKIK
jgi:hypothetical protein